MATLKELNPKVGDRFKRPGIIELITSDVSETCVAGWVSWSSGPTSYSSFTFNGLGDWKRIEESPETVTEPDQSTYASLAAQYGIVIVADGVTYDGTKQ